MAFLRPVTTLGCNLSVYISKSLFYTEGKTEMVGITIVNGVERFGRWLGPTWLGLILEEPLGGGGPGAPVALG